MMICIIFIFIFFSLPILTLLSLPFLPSLDRAQVETPAKKRKKKTITRKEEEESAPITLKECMLCLDNNVEEGNTITECAKCKMAVHRGT